MFYFFKDGFRLGAYVVFFALTLLFLYLMFNIQAVGQETGVGLHMLLLFLFLSGICVFLNILYKKFKVIFYLSFLLTLFWIWLVLRLLVDVGDGYLLRQFTISTTGGVVLFYFIGALSRACLDELVYKRNYNFVSALLILFLIVSIFISMSLAGRMIPESSYFYIEGVDGMYQRPGNLLILLCFISSVSYLIFTVRLHCVKNFFWFLIYSFSMILCLVSSQMFGSNSATANIIGLYIITIVLVLCFKYGKSLFFQRTDSRISFFIILPYILKYFILVSLVFSMFLLTFFYFIDFDVNKLNIMGLGAGRNNSLYTRLDILMEDGVEQLGYAPLFGNSNVAYLTTGVEGRFIHSFFLNIFAELGFVGLFLMVVICCFYFRYFLFEIKKDMETLVDFQSVVLNTWLLLMFLFLLLYANVAVDKSWVVFWFFLGFSITPITFKMNSKVHKL